VDLNTYIHRTIGRWTIRWGTAWEARHSFLPSYMVGTHSMRLTQSCATANLRALPTQFTLSFWIRLESLSTWGVILELGGTVDGNQNWLMQRWEMADVWNCVPACFGTPSQFINSNRFLTLRQDRGTGAYAWYMNGTLQVSGLHNPPVDASNNPMDLGTAWDPSRTSAVYDDVRMYSTILSDDAIKRTMCFSGFYWGSNACVQCPAGKYSTLTGAASEAECTPCSAGKYLTNSAGGTEADSCTSVSLT
jgi:hypothetical protein